jgi:hypothetical protein
MATTGADKAKTSRDALEALADKFERAAVADTMILPEDLGVLGIAKLADLTKLPKTAKSAYAKWGRYKLDNWEHFCAWVYEQVTGDPHPGSKCTGSGFRSQHFAKITADAIRGKSRELLLDLKEDEFRQCLIIYADMEGLQAVTDYLNGARRPEGIHTVNGAVDYNYGKCTKCGLGLHTGRRFRGTIHCPACGTEVGVT